MAQTKTPKAQMQEIRASLLTLLQGLADEYQYEARDLQGIQRLLWTTREQALLEAIAYIEERREQDND